jgi:putative membrane protein
MIVRPRPRGIEYFFLLRGSILPNIWLKLCITIATAMAVTLTHGSFYHVKVTLTTIPFSLMGLALAIFLGFRNSASYERFWEARKLWGTLINCSRNLARQASAFIVTDDAAAAASVREIQRRMALSAAAFAHALRHQLRDEAGGEGSRAGAGEELARLLPAEAVAALASRQNAAAAILDGIGADLRTCLQRGWIAPVLAQEVDRTIGQLADVLGGCERIRHTPLPFSYAVLLHRTVYVYCYLLPFGLVDSIGALTPVVVGIVAYTFFGLDAIGDEIEEPFGLTANDLPLTALSYGIEIAVREAIGDDAMPEMPSPVAYCLQ